MNLSSLSIIFYEILFLLLNWQTALSQFTMTGEIRPRVEYRDGFKELPDSSTSAAFLISQRSRLTLHFSNDRMIVKMSFQDVNVWGDEKLKSDVPNTALHEGWVELKVAPEWSLKVGRQEIYYDNQRLMSNINWLQQGMSHDAALIRFHNSIWKADLGLAFNQLSNTTIFGTDYTNGQGNYKTLIYTWITRNKQNLGISGVCIADGFQKAIDTVHFRVTGGGVIRYRRNNLYLALRNFYQGGKTILGQPISAFYVNVNASYRFLWFSPALGFEYFSGNNNTNTKDTKYMAFNYLYGTGQKFNGHLGYFLRPSSTQNAGLLDIYLKTKSYFSSTVTASFDYHYFSIPNPYRNPVSHSLARRYLGSEADMSLRYRMAKDILLSTGLCLMKATPTLQLLEGTGDYHRLARFAYVMLTVSPEFFKK